MYIHIVCCIVCCIVYVYMYVICCKTLSRICCISHACIYMYKLCMRIAYMLYVACRMSHVACRMLHACIYVFYFKINVILIRISDSQRIIHESGSPPASFWRGNDSSNVSLSFKLILSSGCSSPASLM